MAFFGLTSPDRLSLLLSQPVNPPQKQSDRASYGAAAATIDGAQSAAISQSAELLLFFAFPESIGVIVSRPISRPCRFLTGSLTRRWA